MIKSKKNQSQTGRLAGTLSIKLNAIFMLTVNVVLQERLQPRTKYLEQNGVIQ